MLIDEHVGRTTAARVQHDRDATPAALPAQVYGAWRC
jgi:hypothetical protein